MGAPGGSFLPVIGMQPGEGASCGRAQKPWADSYVTSHNHLSCASLSILGLGQAGEALGSTPPPPAQLHPRGSASHLVGQATNWEWPWRSTHGGVPDKHFLGQETSEPPGRAFTGGRGMFACLGYSKGSGRGGPQGLSQRARAAEAAQGAPHEPSSQGPFFGPAPDLVHLYSLRQVPSALWASVSLRTAGKTSCLSENFMFGFQSFFPSSLQLWE